MAGAQQLATLVNGVIQAVNGTFVDAGNAVRALINADINTSLTSHQVHRIMQAAVQDADTSQADMFVWRLIPLDSTYNQLGGNNQQWSAQFFEKYRNLIIDGQLAARFVTNYRLVAIEE